MGELSNRNFGLIVAYLIPGFLVLWGLGFVESRIATWLEGASGQGPSVGSVLYVTLASLGLGMATSAVRWATVDQVHALTGLRKPNWSDRDLHTKLPAYTWIIENYYRYYQFYSNTFVAMVFAYLVWRCTLPIPIAGAGWFDLCVIVMGGILLAGSRSALSRYYRRAGDLLGS